MTDFSDKNVLAIDTSTNFLKLAVSFGGDRLVKRSEAVEKSHGQMIMRQIDALLESSGVKKADIDAIVVGTGPGSFTGLRIGLAAAKGIAVALGIPVVGVSLFEVAAFKLRDEGQVNIIVPFKKDECFHTLCQSGSFSEESIKAVKLSDLSGLIKDGQVAVFGMDSLAAFAPMPGLYPAERCRYDGSELLYLGIEKLSAGKVEDLAGLEPLYLQKSQAELRFERHHGTTD